VQYKDLWQPRAGKAHNPVPGGREWGREVLKENSPKKEVPKLSLENGYKKTIDRDVSNI
jgi:hypothetical protein